LDAKLESLIGYFVNTLVLRADTSVESHNNNLADYFAHIRQIHLDAQSHQDVPFEQLVECLKTPRSSAHTPLFQIMMLTDTDFGLSDATGDSLSLPGVDISTYQSELVQEKFDLTVSLNISEQGVGLNWSYDVSLFTQQHIEQLNEHMCRLLEGLGQIQGQSQSLNALAILSPAEVQHLVVDLNDTQIDYPRDKCIHELFEQQAALNPDRVALLCEEQTLTYKQLNQKANQLAHYLQQHYLQQNKLIKPDTLVGLCVERSPEMVIGLLAILKAGGAYVPMDPAYPQERLRYMFEDANLDVMLSQTRLHQVLTDFDGTLVNLDGLAHTTDHCCAAYANTNPALDNGPTASNLAYVIYTSGSTGQPKGVLTEHRSVVRLVINPDFMALNQQTVMLQSANIAFDAATLEIWGPLLNGGQSVLYPHQQISPAQLNSVIERHQVNALWLTAGLFTEWSYSAPTSSSLQYLLAGGDVLDPDAIKRVQQANPGLTLINGYGPTESTTFTTLWQAQPFDGPVPLGKATNNRQLYVLNSQLEPVAVGCPGELYIGGDGLALGYLNQPELTQQCFIANPYSDGQLYKSGDLVRWLADGTLQYLGRGDKQVKIRGFRIEPSEVENVLNQLPGIRQAVVIVTMHNDEKLLLAYVVMQAEQVFDNEQLRLELSDKLPPYMLPASFTAIENIPLTANGKLDVKALPAPEFVNVEAYVPPRNVREQQLCSIWQDVLGLERVGVQDNFFRLGGNSINAMRLCAQMKLSLVQLFEQPYISQLAALLSDDEKQQIQIPHIEQNSYPLSFAQQRLLFIEQFEQGSDAYHIPYLIKLADWDLSALTAAINVVAERHPVLKSVYIDNVQRPLETQLTVISHTDLKAVISQPFDLSKEPALKLIHCNDYLLLLFHHIAFDGWSLDIFNQELAHILKGESLPALDISYGDYARWQREHLTGQTKTQLLDYWQQQLGDCEPLTLATDFLRPSRPDYLGADVAFTLDEALSKQLRDLAKAQQTTVYTVLLSGFYVALAAQSGQTDIVVGSPIANREQAEVSPLIGFFVNTLVLRSDLTNNPSF
ncbi:MAG: amino acid adenylation domain-containing protein, partial [Psychrosphaera sp.]|nr:amino acid adenylation domain-containing protein [Psychrosphaera sp.]